MNTIRHTLDPKHPKRLTPEERAELDALTDEEVEERALDDPDNPPMAESERGTFRRVPQVRDIREGLGLSQSEFAEEFGIPVGVIRDWEQRRSFPNQAARSYLRVIARMPEEVRSALRAS
ncbi:helix-turn-helix domain-containing protein [Candidatus Poribacteria bacterium]|nr:helix-turn-helix domain-containing protein [Candidatus Poribacteria bacterium]